jgi:hypothetical protein
MDSILHLTHYWIRCTLLPGADISMLMHLTIKCQENFHSSGSEAQGGLELISTQCKDRCVEKVAADLQLRLGQDDLCNRSVYSGIQALLREFGKFSCAEAVTDGRVFHCAGHVVEVFTFQDGSSERFIVNLI